MTYEVTAPPAPASSALRRIGPAFGSALRRFLAALDAAEDRRELHALTDHMLRDVGLMRDQVDDALRGAARTRDR